MGVGVGGVESTRLKMMGRWIWICPLLEGGGSGLLKKLCIGLW